MKAEIVRTLAGCTNPLMVIVTLKFDRLYAVELRLLILMLELPVVFVTLMKGVVASCDELDCKVTLILPESEIYEGMLTIM